ncbi:hypothetical protein ACLOJK_026654 [Asimina triloba]
MASSGNANGNVLQIIQNHVGVFPAALLYVLLEWVVILILFLDALLFFLATELARFFGLQMPCLHCTRIDPALVRRDPDLCYRDSVCASHAKEMTTLACCRAHGRLADARRMCRDCLASLTDMNSSSEVYRAMAAISGGAPMECSADAKRRIHLKLHVGASSGGDECRREMDRCSRVGQCSCCGKPLRIRVLPDGTEVPEIPLPKLSRSGKNRDWNSSFKELSRTSYRDLKMISDTESQMTTTTTEDSSTVDKGLYEKSNSGSCSVAVSDETFCLLGNQGGSMSMIGSESTTTTKELPPDIPLEHGLDELAWEKDLSFPLPHSTNRASAETEPNNRCSRLLRAKSIGLDEAYALATMNNAKQPSGRRLDKSKSTTIPAAAPLLRKRLSMGRDRVGPESLKNGSLGKVQWKSLLHRLKRQVCLGRKSVMALSTELDQERNASAVAVNQAMAMITRLQEEKAAVQMEALQYQRMMEEQAEYDQEALQVMSDLLAKRETKIKLLESDLVAYRDTFQIECERSGFKEMADDNFPKLRPCASTPSGGISDICASVSATEFLEGDDEEHQHISFLQKSNAKIKHLGEGWICWQNLLFVFVFVLFVGDSGFFSCSTCSPLHLLILMGGLDLLSVLSSA